MAMTETKRSDVPAETLPTTEYIAARIRIGRHRHDAQRRLLARRQAGHLPAFCRHRLFPSMTRIHAVDFRVEFFDHARTLDL